MGKEAVVSRLYQSAGRPVQSSVETTAQPVMEIGESLLIVFVSLCMIIINYIIIIAHMRHVKVRTAF